MKPDATSPTRQPSDTANTANARHVTAAPDVARRPALTLAELGWTEADATLSRGIFAAFLEDWDDPAMDVYDDVYAR